MSRVYHQAVGEMLGFDDVVRRVEDHEIALGKVFKADGAGKGVVLADLAAEAFRMGGKRLRPILTMDVAALPSTYVDETAVTASLAPEIIHIAATNEDDSVDDTEQRHGKPTIHATHGPAATRGLSVYLPAKAYELAAQLSDEAAVKLAQTVTEMALGNTQETAGRFNTARTVWDYNKCKRQKTGLLFGLAGRFGGIEAGFRPRQLEEITEFFEILGDGYQELDDIVDLEEDIGNGVVTLPALIAMDGRHADQTAELFDGVRQGIVEPEEVVQVLGANGSIREAISIVRHTMRSTPPLDSLSEMNPDRVAALREFPRKYLAWQLAVHERQIQSMVAF
jgi:geranylgeranyl pyrophosphate synthase